MTTDELVRHPEIGVGEHRRRRWPIVLAAGLVVVLLAGVAFVLWFTSVLGVKVIEVRGATGDLAAQVQSAADLPTGSPLISIDLTGTERRVEDVPEIASARVTRTWPNSVIITVQVRTPVAVTSANGALWLLDSGGDPYLRVGVAPAQLIVVKLATPGAKDPATLAALKVVDSMTSDFRAQVASVSAPSAYGVTVLLKDGRTVIWGGSDDGARKMQVLPILLKQPGKTYNVTDPEMPAIK